MNLRNHDTSHLKPYGPRVTCLPPKEMDDNTSSIILPEGVRLDLTAAVVVEVGELDEAGTTLPHLHPGDLIFFSHICNRLGEMYIIEFNCIVAYEKLGDQEGGDHGGSLA